MPVIKVSVKTWNEVKQADQTIRLAFGEVLLKEQEQTGASLRDLKDRHGVSHMTIQNLINKAKARRAELENVTA